MTSQKMRASHFGLHQLIKEPSYVLNEKSSCFDLLFTTQPNLMTELIGGLLLLYLLIVIARSCFQNLVWKCAILQHMNANFDIMKNQIVVISDRQQLISPGTEYLQNLNVNKMVHILNKTIKNILSNFILFFMRLLFVTTEIVLGSTAKWKVQFMKRMKPISFMYQQIW